MTVCALAPPLAAVAVSALMLLGAVAGRHPFWRPMVLNLAEASAARDAATVAAAIERGEDPNVPRVVRPPLLDATGDVGATPMEAAVRTGRLEIVALLAESGVVLDAGARRALVCEARDRGYDDVGDYLARPLGDVGCGSR